MLAADIVLGKDMPDYYTETHNWGEEIDLRGDITFDGAGHTISGMRIENDHNHHGLFRMVMDGAEVINLTVEGDIRYTGDSESHLAGGIAGECSHGRIKNCTFRGTIDGGSVDGGSSRTSLTMVGGIVGYAHDAGTISNCTAQGTFTANGAYSQVGGIVGQVAMQTLTQTVKDCHVTEDCHVTGDMAGGIAGYLYGMQNTELRNCSSGADVTGLSRGRGIIGYQDGRGLTACHTTAACRVSSPRYAGGLIGWLSAGRVYGCHSLAEVTGVESENRSGYTGGLVGFGDTDDYIAGCYFAGTAQSPVGAQPFIGHQNYYVPIAATYSSGRVLTGGVEDSSLTGIYYGEHNRLTQVPLGADGQPDWETTTAELNRAITDYNRDNSRDCEFHFVQTDGTSNPPTLAEGVPGAE